MTTEPDVATGAAATPTSRRRRRDPARAIGPAPSQRQPPQTGTTGTLPHGPLRAGAPLLLDRTLLRFGARPLLLLSDLTAIVLASLFITTPHWQSAATGALLLILLSLRRLHAGHLTLSLLDDTPALTGRALAATAAVIATGVVLDLPQLSDRRALTVLSIQIPLLLTLRLLAYGAIRSVRRSGVIEHPTLVLGAGWVAGQLTHSLLEHPEYGLLPVGLLDDDPLLTLDQRPVPLLGTLSDLPKVLLEFRIRNVIVAFGGSPETALIDLIRICDRFDCDVLSVPRLFEMHHTTKDMETIWGVPLVRLRPAAFRRPSWKLKRVLDIAVAGTALLVLWPLMVACALAVRWDTGPKVLFRQTRIGMDGRPFELLKFRSLRPHDPTESATQWSVAQDDRLGAVGKALRASSLDELPQLWNILRGDMTLVGPRPERPHFVQEFSRVHARYLHRHRVPAGLTGWAQVHGLRGDTSIADRARFDNYYIENWSLWGDIKILLRTITATLLHRGS